MGLVCRYRRDVGVSMGVKEHKEKEENVHEGNESTKGTNLKKNQLVTNM